MTRGKLQTARAVRADQRPLTRLKSDFSIRFLLTEEETVVQAVWVSPCFHGEAHVLTGFWLLSVVDGGWR